MRARLASFYTVADFLRPHSSYYGSCFVHQRCHFPHLSPQHFTTQAMSCHGKFVKQFIKNGQQLAHGFAVCCAQLSIMIYQFEPKISTSSCSTQQNNTFFQIKSGCLLWNPIQVYGSEHYRFQSLEFFEVQTTKNSPRFTPRKRWGKHLRKTQ